MDELDEVWGFVTLLTVLTDRNEERFSQISSEQVGEPSKSEQAIDA